MISDVPESILHECEALLGGPIRQVSRVSGGDINQARLLESSRGKYFLKMNTSARAGEMFSAEKKGLALLRQHGPLRIPETIARGETPDGAFLLLAYVETGRRPEGFWEEFGRGLAALHRTTQAVFGLDHDNFIGSLPQRNGEHAGWPAFYREERLQPQLDLALSARRLEASDARNFEKLYRRLPELCPEEPPALTHGDLWSGNFLADETGAPVLIDPAVSYAHRETDLAMSRLFGGFQRAFYRSYEESYPLAPGFEQRLAVYQLYYLMVHVNLFGGGYTDSVRNVLRQFI